MIAKIANFGKKYHQEIVLGIVVACICLISFNLGKMSATQNTSRNAIAIISPPASGRTLPDGQADANSDKTDTRVVASKASSSKLYHFTWCSGAKRIADKNKLYFATEALAKTAGYTLAGNCQP